MNTKVAFRIFIAVLIVVFSLIIYFVFIDEEGNAAESFFEAVGFESSESQDNPAVPLPSGTSGAGSSGSSGGSGGSSAAGSESGSGNVLRFCTFDAFHRITSDVPCRCGFSGVCYESESTCDATFNNGEGFCS